jgi:haloacetate dehalogenase
LGRPALEDTAGHGDEDQAAERDGSQQQGRPGQAQTDARGARPSDLDIHGDPETIWRPWVAGELRSCPSTPGITKPKESPDELASALLQFLG